MNNTRKNGWFDVIGAPDPEFPQGNTKILINLKMVNMFYSNTDGYLTVVLSNGFEVTTLMPYENFENIMEDEIFADYSLLQSDGEYHD